MQTHNFREKSINSVVAISVFDKRMNDFKIIGTGFLLVFFGNYYVITNKHVLDNLDNYYILFAGSELINNDFVNISIKNSNLHETRYHQVDEIDVAVVYISDILLGNFAKNALDAAEVGLKIKELKELNILEGYKVYILGHPLNVSKLNNFFPVMRVGFISQISNLYRHEYFVKTVFIDAFSYPGNSGGPVFINIENKDMIVGIVSSYLSPRGDNIGITNIFAFDHILELLD